MRPAELRFRVANTLSAWRASPGDMIRVDLEGPHAPSFTLEQRIVMHAGQCDRALLSGSLVPMGLSLPEARQALVNALLARQGAP